MRGAGFGVLGLRGQRLAATEVGLNREGHREHEGFRIL
jgi:hypothetical protein